MQLGVEMLCACVGTIGSGKTVLLVHLLNIYREMGYDVYTNIKSLKMPSSWVFSYDGLKSINNGVAGMSEFWIWADSRSSSSKNNKFVSEVSLQSRKEDFDIIYDLQDFGQIDTRIRNITDMIFHAKGSGNLFRYNGIYHQIFYFDVYRRFITGEYSLLRTLSLDLFPDFYLYDTKERHIFPIDHGNNIFRDTKIPKTFKEAQLRKSESLQVYPVGNENMNEDLMDFQGIEKGLNFMDIDF